jgi:hypothetical protein
MQGRSLDVTITGADTHFDDTSQVSFSCQGIMVNSVTANSATELTANITIACDAPQDRCDVSVATGSETITCSRAFEIVLDACDFLAPTVTPSAAGAGETLDVAIMVSYRDVRTIKDLDVLFSCAGITVNSVTANSASTVTANITVADGAAPCSGSEFVTGKTGPCDCDIFCSNQFSITEKPPCALTSSPANLQAGFLLPRWYLVSLHGTGSGFSNKSSVEIEGVRFMKIMNTSAAGNKIAVLMVIPPRFMSSTGVRRVTVTTGDEVCSGEIEIQ